MLRLAHVPGCLDLLRVISELKRIVSLHNYGQSTQQEERPLLKSEKMISQNYSTPSGLGVERQERVWDTANRRRRSDFQFFTAKHARLYM
jgi:hypothetical protein